MHWIKRLAIENDVDEEALRRAIHTYWVRNENDIIEREVNKNLSEILLMVKEDGIHREND